MLGMVLGIGGSGDGFWKGRVGWFVSWFLFLSVEVRLENVVLSIGCLS